MVIDESLIVSDNIIEKPGRKSIREIVVRKDNPNSYDGLTKLSHIFDEIPFGLIHKEETGIGATTLEIISKRNSIIVEPTRVTAYSKAKKHPGVLYIGGKTKYIKATSNKEIATYLNDPKILPKKMVVVADSLYRLIEVLENGINDDFFFMIDEIDSFQLDSSFRKSMENCLDTYKSFPVEKRAMVTATSLEFSDPSINDDITVIKYDFPNYRTINLFYAIKIKTASVIKISELLKKYPNDKLMVAYNSVNGCFDITKHLIKNEIIKQEDVKILCSINSREKVEDFFVELETEELPARLNFCTSAYFTGYDLKERYHLVSISSNTSRIHTLSDKRLKQIAGRCRDKEGLLSETIIYDIWFSLDEKIYSVDDCIAIAQKEISALNCIKHNYEGHPLLKSNIDAIRELIVESTKINGYRFVRFNSNREPVVSYLNIDAFIEQFRVRNELYSEEFALYDALIKAGHMFNVFKKIWENDPVDKNDIGKADRIEQVKYIIKLLKNPDTPYIDIELLLQEKTTSHLQKYILRNYVDFKEYIGMEKFLSLMHSAGEMRDNRKLNNLILGAYYLTLNPMSHYKRTVKHHLPIGPKLTSLELLQRWNTIFIESGIHKQLETVNQAVRLTRLHYRIIKKRDPVTYFIKAENPFKLILIKTRAHEQYDTESISNLLTNKIT